MCVLPALTASAWKISLLFFSFSFFAKGRHAAFFYVFSWSWIHPCSCGLTTWNQILCIKRHLAMLWIMSYYIQVGLFGRLLERKNLIGIAAKSDGRLIVTYGRGRETTPRISMCRVWLQYQLCWLGCELLLVWYYLRPVCGIQTVGAHWVCCLC